MERLCYVHFDQGRSELVIQITGGGVAEQLPFGVPVTVVADTLRMMAARLERGAKEREPKSETATRCQQRLMAHGKPYPRTCEVCGLGPCRERMVPNAGAQGPRSGPAGATGSTPR